MLSSETPLTPQWAMGLIFISYRRDDNEQIAPRISERLEKRFGKHNIFFDVDSIPPGTDFRDVLEQALERTDVLLAIIGKHWIEGMRRRLDDRDDFVRFEIASALSRGIRVIPLIIRGARMPSAKDLPSDLVKLASRQAIEIRFDREFNRDVDRLIKQLLDERLVPPNPAWGGWRKLRSADPDATAGAAPPSKNSENDSFGSKDLPPHAEKPTKPVVVTAETDAAAPSSEKVQGTKSNSEMSSLEAEVVAQLRQTRERLERAPKSVTTEATGSAASIPLFVRFGSHVTGPFSRDQLRSMRSRGEFSPLHQVSVDRVHWESGAMLSQTLDRLSLARSDGSQPSGAAVFDVCAEPGAVARESPADPNWYYADSSRRRTGPISENDLRDLIRRRRLPRATLVCKQGENGWEWITRRPEFASDVPKRSTPPWVAILVLCFIVILLLILTALLH